jgi:hypothetical protein
VLAKHQRHFPILAKHQGHFPVLAKHRDHNRRLPCSVCAKDDRYERRADRWRAAPPPTRTENLYETTARRGWSTVFSLLLDARHLA